MIVSRSHDAAEGFVGGWAGFALERAYLAAVAWRRARQLTGPRVRPGLPVVSIGNLSAGGTGKTPCAIWAARVLESAGVRVAIVARPVGGAVPGAAGDELALLAERVPGALIVAAHSKAEGAAQAAEALRGSGSGTPGVVLVDDGFSHWRLARDLDVVLVDAARPIGNGHLLPRGRLREEPTALARADAVIATRADRVAPELLEPTLAALARLAPQAIVAAAAHVPTGLFDAAGRAIPCAPGERVVCLSGIARAGDLAASARALGLTVVEDLCYADHHRFTGRQWRDAETRAHRHGARLVVSAKDAVRLTADRRARAAVLEVDWRFLSGEADVRARLLLVAAKGTA